MSPKKNPQAISFKKPLRIPPPDPNLSLYFDFVFEFIVPSPPLDYQVT
ncbi:MAG: hypothetical protein R3E32_09025 [Chitinophagales bacterium]